MGHRQSPMQLAKARSFVYPASSSFLESKVMDDLGGCLIAGIGFIVCIAGFFACMIGFVGMLVTVGPCMIPLAIIITVTAVIIMIACQKE